MSGYAIRKDKLGWRAVDGSGDVMDSEFFSSTPPEAAATQPVDVLASYEAAIEDRLDLFAQARGYHNGDRLSSYRGSSNTTWAAEADRFIELRDLTWAKFFSIADEVNTGKREMPMLDELFNELPALIWSEQSDR